MILQSELNEKWGKCWPGREDATRFHWENEAEWQLDPSSPSEQAAGRHKMILQSGLNEKWDNYEKIWRGFTGKTKLNWIPSHHRTDLSLNLHRSISKQIQMIQTSVHLVQPDKSSCDTTNFVWLQTWIHYAIRTNWERSEMLIQKRRIAEWYVSSQAYSIKLDLLLHM